MLHLPPSRRSGADPVKLQRQIARYGKSTAGMPPPEVKRGADGRLVRFDGVTRATRIAKLLPGIMIVVEVTGQVVGPIQNLPTIKERL